jgi:hypothetical protein
MLLPLLLVVVEPVDDELVDELLVDDEPVVTPDTPVKAPLLMVSVIVICSPCVPAGIEIGWVNTHDRPPSVKPLMPIPLPDGLLTSNVKVALPELIPLKPTACTCSVAVFDAEPAKPKTHTATATANAIATAISIIVATTFDIPLLFILFVDLIRVLLHKLLNKHWHVID